MVNFRLKHLNKSKKINIIITPLKPKFYSKTFSFNLFNIDKAERVHMNIILCQGSSWSYFFVNFLILVFFWHFGALPATDRTERSGCSGRSVWLPWFLGFLGFLVASLVQIRVARNGIRPLQKRYPNLIENCRCNVEPYEFIQTPAKTMIRNPSLIENCTCNFETYECNQSNLEVGLAGNVINLQKE